MIGKKALTSFKYGYKLLVLLIFLCFIQHFLLIHQLQSIPPPTVESPTLPSSTEVRRQGGSSFSPCTKNPYLGAMEPLSDITEKMDDWFQNLNELGTKSMKR
jgi:hypothetical protein